MDLNTVYPDASIAMYTDCSKWGNSDLPCGVDRTLDIIKAELLHLHIPSVPPNWFKAVAEVGHS